MTRTTCPLATLVATAVALSACTPAPGTRAVDHDALRGVALEEPFVAPDFTLPDTDGQPFAFRAQTDGFVTLLFFGYTNCPDICPVHLANIAAVLGDLPYPERSRFRVVFVTVDPERDTPDVVRAYLDRFDGRFTGLVGPLDRVNEIQAEYQLPPAVVQEVRDRSAYLVGHASQVLAISADGRVRAAYPSGLRQADWAHDLPRLLALTDD